MVLGLPGTRLKPGGAGSDGLREERPLSDSVEEDIQSLEIKLGQLKREYDQYFLGTRPREPVMLAGEVRKLIAMLSNQAIRNTALKFRFSSLCSRYQAFNRQWQDTVRQMEQGTYTRHRFRASLHQGAPPSSGPGSAPSRGLAADDPDLFAAYAKARTECGQGVKNLSQDRLEAALRKQEAQLRKRYGDAEIRFRVVVEDGVAKVKAGRA